MFIPTQPDYALKGSCYTEQRRYFEMIRALTNRINFFSYFISRRYDCLVFNNFFLCTS